MLWRYHFLDLTEAQKHARRETLTRYALYAQLSAMVPLSTFLACRLAKRLATLAVSRGGAGNKGAYKAVPSSPSPDAVGRGRKRGSRGDWGGAVWGMERGLKRVRWWLGGDVVFAGWGLGTREQWFIGLIWGAWLFFLSVHGTGEDYLHLTKRLGLIALSQYPLQYLLSLKSSISPLTYILPSSHEHLNQWHRVLSRISTILLSAHATLYLNFFVQTNRWNRLGDGDVIAGLAAIGLLGMMIGTALRPIRRLSYRLFFVLHVLVALFMPVLVLFHVKHSIAAKIFAIEALVVFVLDLAARKVGTVIADATVEAIPGTELVRVKASMPREKIKKFRAAPGGHVYLSLPPAAREGLLVPVSKLVYEFLYNPFTLASVDSKTNTVTLVAKIHQGPMTSALASFAYKHKSTASSSSNKPDEDTDSLSKTPLAIEGPYGLFPRRFADLVSGKVDRVLLVAGGVGATFVVPVYRALKGEAPSLPVRLVWAVRQAGEATWALAEGEAENVLGEEGVEVYITGAGAGDSSSGEDANIVKGKGKNKGKAKVSVRVEKVGPADSQEGVELTHVVHDLQTGRSLAVGWHRRQRPDLKRIVDEVFTQGRRERVAVLVCGPHGMQRELRGSIGKWVAKGREVYWHAEAFDL